MAPKAAEQKAGKSKAEKKPVKVVKAEKKPAKEGGKKKKRAKSIESYKMYIYKVLKQVSVSVTEFGTLHCFACASWKFVYGF
jgi:histone H2B